MILFLYGKYAFSLFQKFSNPNCQLSICDGEDVNIRDFSNKIKKFTHTKLSHITSELRP